MKKLMIFAVGIGLVVLGVKHKPLVIPVVQGCDQTLWTHVYNPQRLKMIEQCKTVTGTISNIKSEADGDYHIRLTLDPQFKAMLNAKNMSDQHGDLVIEPVCMNAVSQIDAISACKGYKSSLIIPKVGTHVTVTGSYVLDIPHSWNEIHPISSIVKNP